MPKTAPLVYRIYNNLGASYARLENFDLAIEYYQKSIAIYHEYKWDYGLENLSVLYRNMARSSTDQNDYSSALKWIEKSDNYLETCLLKDSTFLAAIHSDKIRNREKELLIYMNSYELNKDKKDLIKAYNAGKSAFSQYLILRSMVYGDQTRMIALQEIKKTVDKLVKICLELGKVDEAFFICEKTKYLNLLEHLDNFKSSSISEVASRLQLIPTSIHDLREILEAKNKTKIYLEQEIEQFGQVLNQTESPCIYSYYLLEDRYILFVRKNNITQYQNLEKAETIDSLIVSFLDAVKIRKPVDSYSQRLNLHLLPNREIVDTTILVIPHGHLAKMPFAALKEDDEYLISNIEFNYKKSLLLPNSIFNSKLNMGIQPQYEGSILNGKLPFAKDEAQFLKENFGFEVLQKEKATLENLTKLNADLNVAHIIGHYNMATENYRNSYFSLSNDQKWTPLDILNTSLRSNLLVLSACSTADGEFDLEEGIRGISYIFNIAGNNNQITTNWSVDDEANFTIIKSLYKNLNGKNTTGQALRLSQLEYLDNASILLGHPYFWAGIRYEGDPELKIAMVPKKKINYSLIILGLFFLLALYFIINRKFNY